MSAYLNRCLIGDCRDSMREMIAAGVKVQTCISSPPYYALRDYQTGTWEGGSAECDHTRLLGGTKSSTLHHYDNGLNPETIARKVEGYSRASYRGTCGKCGATRIDKQIGLENSPSEYIASLVEVFRLVRELLDDSGLLWIVIGDSFCSTDKWGGGKNGNTGKHTIAPNGAAPSWEAAREKKQHVDGIKPKNLYGIPWRLAFALQDDGWWLRSEIIWEKPNAMPSSVSDRCSVSHETIFMLSKNGGKPLLWRAKDTREWSTTPNLTETIVNSLGITVPRWSGFDYYYDAAAIAEPASGRDPGNITHKGVTAYENGDEYCRTKGGLLNVGARETRNKRSVWSIPTQPFSDAHFAVFPPKLIEPMVLASTRIGDTVLDPFFGSGTTGEVAQSLNRNWVGCDLNAGYAPLQQKRTAQTSLVLA